MKIPEQLLELSTQMANLSAQETALWEKGEYEKARDLSSEVDRVSCNIKQIIYEEINS